MNKADEFMGKLMAQAVSMRSASAMLAVAVLAGCAANAGVKPADGAAPAKPAPAASVVNVESEIASVAKSIDSSLTKLTEIEQSSKKAVIPPRPNVQSGPLALRVSVLWKGPVEPILMKLSEESGYQYRTIGKKSAIPVMVNLDVKDQPILDVLRSIGLQLGDQATVKVSSKNKTIEVAYAGE